MLYYYPFHTHKDFAKSVYDEIAYGLRTPGIGEEVRKRVEVVVRTVGLLALLDEGPLFLSSESLPHHAPGTVKLVLPPLLQP